MHLEVFLKLKKPLKPSILGKKIQKTPKKPKTQKTQKKPLGWGLKKTGFFQPWLGDPHHPAYPAAVAFIHVVGSVADSDPGSGAFLTP